MFAVRVYRLCVLADSYATLQLPGTVRICLREQNVFTTVLVSDERNPEVVLFWIASEY